jgi:hypothetical protein
VQELPGIGARVRQVRQLQQLAEADHVALDLNFLHRFIVAGARHYPEARPTLPRDRRRLCGPQGRDTYVDEASGRQAAHAPVSAREAKPADGLLSIDSPVGRALAGAQSGDSRSLQTPKGTRTMRVLAVEHS